MKVSVVIPTHNRKDSLRRTLDGLSQQTLPCDDFEAIVISDGSTDGTDEMLVEHAHKAPYALHAISQPNSGPSVARNRGVREARHEVIVFLDDDVQPVPEFLARHAAHHIADEKIVVIGPMSPDPKYHSDEPAWIAWEHAKLQQTYGLFKPGGKLAESDAGPMHFYSGNASVRRQWLDAVGGFDEAFKRQEDVELANRLARACKLRFRFDFAADGLHRPSRTFESWLRIPKAYGTLDAQRVLSGQLAMESVQWSVQRRNRFTHLLTSVLVAMPFLSGMATWVLKSLALLLYARGPATASFAMLSGLYNATYSQAFVKTLRTNEHKARGA